MPSGVTRFTVWALAACAGFAAVEVAEELGAPVPRGGLEVLGTLAAVLAAMAAIRNVAHVRRGPSIVEFQRRDATLCDARESAAIRAAAQLRGTMGGAGYLFPRRLAFSAVGWAATGVQAALLAVPEHGTATFLPLGVAVLAVLLTARFPAIPFYYRETVGQCVVAFPADACSRLLEAARLAPTPTGVELAALGTRGEAEAAPAQALDAAPPARRQEPEA